MLGHVRELVRQEHDPGRIRQAAEQADQAHLRAIVGREIGIGVVADQHQTRRRLVEQPGAERTCGQTGPPGRDAPLRVRRRQTASRRQAGARMIRNDLRDPRAARKSEERVDVGCRSWRRAWRCRGADRPADRLRQRASAAQASTAQQAGEQPGEDDQPRDRASR